MGLLRDLFGPGTWGTGGNMVAWVICGAIGFGWLHAKEKARHLAKMAQAERHHAELMATATAAQQIAADTYEHQTGHEHELAPRDESEVR